MSGPSDEDLQKIRDDNMRLREKIAAAKATKREREAQVTREVAFAELVTENTRLEAELANATEAAKVGSVKAGSESLMANLKEGLETAVAQGEATIGPVDTNADNQPKGTTGAIIAVDTDKDKTGGNS